MFEAEHVSVDGMCGHGHVVGKMEAEIVGRKGRVENFSTIKESSYMVTAPVSFWNCDSERTRWLPMAAKTRVRLTQNN